MERLLNRLAALTVASLFGCLLGFAVCCLLVTVWDLAGLHHSSGVTLGWMTCGLTFLGGVFCGCRTDCA